MENNKNCILEKLQQIVSDYNDYKSTKLSKSIKELNEEINNYTSEEINDSIKNISEEVEYKLYIDVLEILYNFDFKMFKVILNNTSNNFVEKNLNYIQNVNSEQLYTSIHTMNFESEKVLQENNKYIKDHAKDDWQYIQELSNRSKYMYLDIEVKLKNILVNKYDLNEWISWVDKLPFDELKILCINEMYGVNDLENISNTIKTAMFLDIDRATKYMFMQQYLDIYERKYNDLKIDEDKQNLKNSFKDLISEFDKEYIKNDLIYILKYVSVKQKLNQAPQTIRTVLVSAIKETDINIKNSVKIILDENINASSIISSIFLIDNKDEEVKNILIDSYMELLNNGYITLAPFDVKVDYGLCIWLMAGVIQSTEAALDKIKYMLEKVYVKRGGWNFNYSKYYESIKNVSNICTISAMICEWMTFENKEQEKIKEIYDFTWDYVIKFMRNNPRENLNVEEAMRQLWGRLPLAYKGNEDKIQSKVLAAIKKMDNIQYVLIALHILKININKHHFSFSVEILSEVRNRYKDYLRILLECDDKNNNFKTYDNIAKNIGIKDLEYLE